MCEPSKNLKLCTCGTVEVSEMEGLTWKLTQLGACEDLIMGEVVPQYATQPFEKHYDLFLSELNDRNVFDFSYQPKKGDFLSICQSTAGRDFNFRFNGRIWEKSVRS